MTEVVDKAAFYSSEMPVNREFFQLTGFEQPVFTQVLPKIFMEIQLHCLLLRLFVENKQDYHI
jgi:hypothetical protein